MLRRAFLFSAAPALAAKCGDPLLLRAAGGRVDVMVKATGAPLTSFHHEAKWDKPFLYPLRSPKGRIISRGWPVAPRPGESADHIWHRGIWWVHGDVNKQDFWREQGRDKTSILAARKPATIRGQSLSIDLAMKTPSGELIGTVRQAYSFQRCESTRIDARISILADRGRPLVFGDTDDGGFAIRLADEFRQDRKAVLINSEGLETTEKIWGKPARWVDYSASNGNGEPCGVTLMDHPKNPRHPTTWHARGYSLNAANPFGLRSFTRDKTKDGSYTLARGGRVDFAYRVWIHEGMGDREAIEREYRDWEKAAP
jgi:hypothetical protein